MTWTEARDRSLEQWRSILAALGDRDPDELVIWSETAYGLCDKARELAHTQSETAVSICRLCLAYQQQGGCLEARDRFALALLAGNLDRAREIVRGHISDLELLEVPEGDEEGVTSIGR